MNRFIINLAMIIIVFTGCSSSDSDSAKYDFWEYLLSANSDTTKFFDGIVVNSDNEIISSYYGIIKHDDFKTTSFGYRSTQQLLGSSDFISYTANDTNITSDDLNYKRQISKGDSVLLDTSIRECIFSEYKSVHEPHDGYVYNDVIIFDCTYLGEEDYQIGYSKNLGIVYYSKPYNYSDRMYTLFSE